VVDSETGDFIVIDRRFLKKRKKNLRGTRYSIPIPKGGREGRGLVLREDVYYDRIRKTHKQVGKKARGFDFQNPLERKVSAEKFDFSVHVCYFLFFVYFLFFLKCSVWKYCENWIWT
jgi:hypothetical protein